MSDRPFKACCTSKRDEPYLYGVEGPVNGIGYNAWYLFPENAFASIEEAEKAARLMNLAFAAGQAHRSQQLKELIG